MVSLSPEPTTGPVSFGTGDAATYLERLRPYAAEIEGELVDVSHQIHERPEVRFQEEFASQLLMKRLREHGFAVDSGVADLRTAFVGRASNTGGGPEGQGGGKDADRDDGVPTLAIFCEYDALEGVGHGCGHNIIASAGLGAAIMAKRWLEDNPDVPGRLVVLGSPGEEGGGGKIYLIQAGYLEGIDAAMMIHPGGDDRARRRGLARMLIEVEFTGRAAHAASAPHEGINALDAANLTLVAVGLLRQQIRSDARIHGIVVDGGQAPNIIPERTALRMYVRSPDIGYLGDRLVPAVENCVRGAALATGASAQINYPTPAYENMRSNEVLTQLSEANLEALGRPVDADPDDTRLGSTDMGNVSQVVPSIHPHIRLVPGLTMHTHTAAEAASSAAGDKAVVDGALELAMTAAELYSQPELLSAATAAFREGR